MRDQSYKLLDDVARRKLIDSFLDVFFLCLESSQHIEASSLTSLVLPDFQNHFTQLSPVVKQRQSLCAEDVLPDELVRL